jgi:hypothetical protein
MKCDEGDLNPEAGFSGDESHSADSQAESSASDRSSRRFSYPVPTQLSLALTPKTGTVPVVESGRRPRPRRRSK